MDHSLPGFSVHGIFQARILEWVAIYSPGDLPNPRIENGSPTLLADALPSEPGVKFCQKAFFGSIEMTVWFLFFHLLTWYVKLIDLCILKNVRILGINFSWAWYMILLMCGWIVCCCSVLKLCSSLWDPTHRSMPDPLSFSISQSLLRFMSIESMMLSDHLTLYHPLLLVPSIFPSIRVFSNELALHIRWPKCWCFSFSIRPSSEYSGLISFRMDWIDLAHQGLSRVFSSTTVWKHQFFSTQPSLWSSCHICMWLLEKP